MADYDLQNPTPTASAPPPTPPSNLTSPQASEPPPPPADNLSDQPTNMPPIQPTGQEPPTIDTPPPIETFPEPTPQTSSFQPEPINPTPEPAQEYPPTPADQDIQAGEELPSPQPEPATTPQPPILPETPSVNTPQTSQLDQDSKFEIIPPEATASSTSPAQTPPLSSQQPFLAYPTTLQQESILQTNPVQLPQQNMNEPEPIPTPVSPLPVQNSPPTFSKPIVQPSPPQAPIVTHRGVNKLIVALVIILILGGAGSAAFWFGKPYISSLFGQTTQTASLENQQPIVPEKSQEETIQRDSSGFVLGESVQNFISYSDPQKDFSIEIPQDWKVLPAEKPDLAADFSSANGTFRLIVKNPQKVDSIDSLDFLTEEQKTNIQTETKKPQITPSERILVNGLSANRFETIEQGDGQTLKATYLLVFKNNQVFTIKAWGPQATFGLKNIDFERILSSFK